MHGSEPLTETKGRSTGHIQQRVIVGDRSADIDIALVPLVKALWHLEIFSSNFLAEMILLTFPMFASL